MKTSEGYEGQIVFHVFGFRFRFYLGHTDRDRGPLRCWKSGLGSRGIYFVPWGNRAIGAQVRKTTN